MQSNRPLYMKRYSKEAEDIEQKFSISKNLQFSQKKRKSINKTDSDHNLKILDKTSLVFSFYQVNLF